MKKLYLIFLLFALVAVKLGAQKDRFPYVVVIQDSANINVSDSLFYQNARKVQFPVGRYTIPTGSSFKQEMLNEVFPQFTPEEYKLDLVMLRGASSPEGSYGFNARLAHLRQQSILNFLIKEGNYRIQPSRVSATEIAEDYSGLVLLMKEAGDADYQFVSDLVAKYQKTNPLQIKRELIKAQSGKLWKRLFAQYFPKLRTAKLMLFFSQSKPDSCLTPVPVPDSIPEAIAIRLDDKTPAQQPVVAPAEVPNLQPVEMPANIVPATKSDVAIIAKDTVEYRRELLSVKTNLLFYGAYFPDYGRWCPIPNVAIEYYPKYGHFTYGASIDFPWWQDYWGHKYFQVRNYQVESRYYFRSGSLKKRGYDGRHAFRGFYAKGYAHVGLFGLCFDENHGYVGEGAGAGIGFGGVIPLGKKSRWTLELGAQVGYFYCKYDPFQYECPVNPAEQDHLYYYKWTEDAALFQKRQYRWSWLGPTRAEVTLSYDLLYRKRHSKGISFRKKEKGGRR